MSKAGKTKSERRFYSGMAVRFKAAVNDLNSDKPMPPEKAKNLCYVIETSVAELKIPKHHPHKRVNK